MNRVAGIETEYGCLVSDENGATDSWPAKIRNQVFRKLNAGALDLHYRDYEEPPGNGGFLLNGGRIYVDMGHLEYASPECSRLIDAVAADLAGDRLVQEAVRTLRAEKQVAFIKNNVDHQTGATFGCHENYLMKREVEFTPEALGMLLSFLATRQIFTGAGRVGQANPLTFEHEPPSEHTVDFQLSQRSDHIVNDIYQWVQFNRAIINARDEPLADHRRYRRLHLLMGDSNMSPYANALKIGITSLILTLLEEGIALPGVRLRNAVTATRQISRNGTGRGAVELENGKTRDALDIQYAFLSLCREQFSGSDPETDWLLNEWEYTLDALCLLEQRPGLLIGAVDWISKRYLLNLFREEEGLTWDHPWLQSLDLEYHNIDRNKGLFHTLEPPPRVAGWNAAADRPEAVHTPPDDTRAAGRGQAVARLMGRDGGGYVINWDSLTLDGRSPLSMADPFLTYCDDVGRYLS